MSVQLRNREHIEEYSISEEWYKNRRRGISAMLRVKNEEEFIKPCIVSIKDFFDEVVIVLNQCTDSTPQIITQLNLPQVKVFAYPFDLHHNGPGHDHLPENSVYDSSYFYNWTLSKTQFQHVCKWDGDMVALPNFDTRLRNIVLNSTIVRITEFNIAGDELAYLSREAPRNSEPRFFKVARDTYYRQGKLCEEFTHSYGEQVRTMETPVFLHFKNAKSMESATKLWPAHWREIPHFQKLTCRRIKGEVYRGVYPDALREKIIDRALKAARKGGELRDAEGVMKHSGELLFRLRNRGLQGDMVEMGPVSKTMAIFLRALMETLFPEHRMYTLDPFTIEAGEKSFLLNGVKRDHGIDESSVATTQGLNNYHPLTITSTDTEEVVPGSVIFSFIEGTQICGPMKHGVKMLFDKTVAGGIIALSGLHHTAMPELKRTYKEIVGSHRVMPVGEDSTTLYLVKKPRFAFCWTS